MLKRLEKHNIITLVRQNSLLEFTKKDLWYKLLYI